MSETLVIEAVSDKFKNKYNNGSVKAGGKWYQVATKVPFDLFQVNSQVTVETKTNDKGYTSIVGVVNGAETASQEAMRPVKRTTKAKTETLSTAQTVKIDNYEDNKNKRIQVQGVLQAVVQSPAAINFGDDVNTIASKVLVLTDLLIAGMNERV